ncbi:hypothetical protein GCM10023338_21800 [Wohlfahrtiimonas larvae]|uniref:Uncharacterized protein n=1 Tax=Wohlfahrtiimonas larvae TaxID=1157986 RepID=A0ABP9MWR2_9GAMM
MILSNAEIKYINTAPYSDNTTFKKQIEECCLWLQSELGIPLRGRIQEYQKHIKWYEKNRGNFNDDMYYCLQSFFEMNQIVEVHKYLSDISGSSIQRQNSQKWR